jgi:hypothetical protein
MEFGLMAKSILAFVTGALIGFSLVGTAVAGSEHYSTNDWDDNPLTNPEVYQNENMYHPLHSYESRLFLGDDPWDNVSGAWLNLLMLGYLDIEHSGTTPVDPDNIGQTGQSVPEDTIWITDFFESCSGDCFGVTLGITKMENQAPFPDWQHGLIVINEDGDINWAAPGDNTPNLRSVDYDSVLIHEMGHGTGMFHTDSIDSDCPDHWLTITESIWNGWATMCSTVVMWNGTQSLPATWPMRTLLTHEADDHAANY